MNMFWIIYIIDIKDKITLNSAIKYNSFENVRNLMLMANFLFTYYILVYVISYIFYYYYRESRIRPILIALYHKDIIKQ